MGMRRPMPKALEVIFRPGAACRRLYSFLSMVRITQLHGFRLKPQLDDVFVGAALGEIVIHDPVQEFIRRQGVLVRLVRAQLRRGGLADG